VYQKQLRLLRPADLAGVVAVLSFTTAMLLSRRRTVWLAAGLTAVELFAFNAGFNRLVDGKYFRPSLPIVAAIRQHAPREPFRVVGRDWVFLPNSAAQYGLEDIRGSDPMSYAFYTRALSKVAVVEPGTDVARVVNEDDPLIDFLNVRFLLAEPGANAGPKWELLYRGVDGSLFENRLVRPRFFAAGAHITIERRSASDFRLVVSSPEAVTVESSEPAGPGWRITVRGESVPVRQVREGFLSFDVPKGESEVVIRYAPLAFYGAIPVALASLLVLGIGGPRRSFVALE
jgi:hypothetical protein